MKNTRTTLSLVALSVSYALSAAAAPPDNHTPARDACRPEGATLFQIDQRAEPDAKQPTSTTKVFANGAWTLDETDADGKAAAQRAGCFAKGELKKLETTLAGAPWKITVSDITCKAMSSTFTVFHVNGKEVFTKRLCGRESLDDKSRTKLDSATAQVKRETMERAKS
jgi:hypothetical protein